MTPSNAAVKCVALCTILICAALAGVSLTRAHESGSLVQILPPTPLSGIDENLSGLTWNAETNTLFAVTNEPERVFEISPEGRVLRSIALRNFKDVEDIVHIRGSLFAVVEERSMRLHVLHLGETTTEVLRDESRSVQLDRKGPKNKRLESVGFNPVTKTLYTMREGKPYVLIAIPFDGQDPSGNVKEHPLPLLRVKDVAAIVCDPDGTMWILSEDSSAIVHLDHDGKEIRRFKLHIDKNAFQPEGLTRTPDGRFFIAGEPNILAVYTIAP